MAARRVHAIVSGRVQGVSYRATTADEADGLGLTGWVRNLPDGRVELEAEGPDDAIAALLAWCAKGPPAARVTAVATTELAPTGADRGFAIRR
ncbi:MAG: acylphosphatase [Myxococcales bacterium]|nr:acylphosphatase [Myxococcales bacterium]